MKYRNILLAASLISSASFATSTPIANQKLSLQDQPGFFRFSDDNLKMPQGIQNMDLLGINYFLNLSPQFYAGIGGYSSVTGTQGGLFVFGAGAGLRHEFIQHWSANVGFFLGGGGGRSSLVGGGLMIRPDIGITYDWGGIQVGLHYSYIDFPTGQIKSSQIGLDIDIPWDFYYIPAADTTYSYYHYNNILLPNGKFLDLQKNDFSILLQAYRQQSGTKNTFGETQDGTIGLVGAELDHYMTDHIFWYIKAAGAYSGNVNGYMDIFGGVGDHLSLGAFALVPQLGIGAGGGGNINTGGGILVQPQLGLEVPLSRQFAARLSGGYIWAPSGSFRTISATGEIIYHLGMVTAKNTANPDLFSRIYVPQNWRFQLFNQTYLHPERTGLATRSAIQLFAFQADQFFSPIFFLSYQAASAYSGNHAGGYATGMIGPGFQTKKLYHSHLQLFTELLVGAGGGGSLALGGGEIIEPLIGLHYALTPAIGLQTSVCQITALHSHLNTPIFNLGLTLNFGMLT